MRPLRVLRIITRLNVGGPAKHVAWLMAGLDPGRFEQRLLAGGVQAGEDDLGPWVRAQGVDYDRVAGLGRSLNPLRDLRCLAALWRQMVRFRPHLVATHMAKAGFLGRLALLLYRPWARLRGWPRPRVVHTFHGHTFHSYWGPLAGALFLRLERMLARRATWRIVAISPGQKREIQEHYGVGRPEQFRLIPLGIDLSLFQDPAAGRRRFRQEMQAGQEEILIGAVGRLAPVKNYPLLIDTAAALRSAHPRLFQHCRFLIIGGGSARQIGELNRQAAEAGLGERLRLLGNRDDPQDFFPGLDLLLLTSHNEGTPVAILEGGACGLPVVATEVGGVADLLGAEAARQPPCFTIRQRGLSAPSGQAAALAAALAHLMDHRGQAAELGRSLRDYVMAHHGKERLIQDIDALYREYERPGERA